MKVGFPFLIICGLCFLVNSFFLFHLKAQTAPTKHWDKTFGGFVTERMLSLEKTSDGGYILGGYSHSDANGDKSQANRGPAITADFWIVKMDAGGNKLWDKTIGGSNDEYFAMVQQTTDGGFIVGGRSSSSISGEKTQPSKGDNDYWLVKLDANGNKTWDKTFGGSEADALVSLQQTSDGGYILGGFSQSGIGGDKTQANKGFSGTNDYWVLKLDALGNKVWDKTFGGEWDDMLIALQQTADGGYLLGGYSQSGIGGDKTQISNGDYDYWVVKLNASGNKTWDKSFGGNELEVFSSLKQTSDGGYILGGSSSSGFGGSKTQGSQGYTDYWIVKLNASGNKLWDKTFGGNGYDVLESVKQTSDGGYILGGISSSGLSSDKTESSRGGSDYWIVKLDGSGNKTWDKTFGGSEEDWLYCLQQLPDGSFILGGSSDSGVSGDKTAASKGFQDMWVVKLNPPCPAKPIVAPKSNCGAGSVTLIATGAPAGGSYVWYDAATGGQALHTSSSGTFTTPSLNITTTYYVAATNNLGCEGLRSPVIVTIKTLAVNAGSPEKFCSGSAPVQITGFSPAGGIWSGAGVSPSGVFKPANNLIGNQVLTYSVIQNGCSFSASKQIEIYKPANLGPDIEACDGEEVTLLGELPTGIFLWSDGSENAFLKVQQSGTYWLQHKQDDCATADTIRVTFKKCLNPFIPNIITPNHDDRNDTFKPQNLPEGKWELQIFNRWGAKLFETDDYKNNWPSTKIANGTYYYLLKNSEAGKQYKGWIEVVQ